MGQAGRTPVQKGRAVAAIVDGVKLSGVEIFVENGTVVLSEAVEAAKESFG